MVANEKDIADQIVAAYKSAQKQSQDSVARMAHIRSTIGLITKEVRSSLSEIQSLAKTHQEWGEDEHVGRVSQLVSVMLDEADYISRTIANRDYSQQAKGGHNV